MNSPAAWHPDPSGAHEHRYWDGERWTEHVADAGVAAIDPLPDAPPADRGTAGDTEVIEHGDTEVARDRDTEVIEHGDKEVVREGDGSPEPADRSADTAGQPAPPTGAPLDGARSPTRESWSGSTAAPPGGGAQPPAWAGQASSGPGWGTAPAAASTGLATTALVLGIVSLPLLIFFGLGALLGIAAIVVGTIAVRRSNRGEAGGRGMAIGGIATGAVSVVLGILIVVALIAFGFGFADEVERCVEETGSRAVCQERLERELTERFLGE